jgi:riboflavin kinase / FMN adenylyltransferase
MLHFGLPAEHLGPAVLTIGSFDGVHLGHQRVVGRMVGAARACGARPVLITFEPHPRCFLDPVNCPKSITALQEKAGLLESMGVEHVVVLEFNRELAQLNAQDFVASLASRMELRRFVVGYDFTFGHNRQGNAEWLRGHGFDVDVVEPVRLDGEEIHSSEVRRLVTLGEVAAAARLLGRSFSLQGMVEPGDRIGRQLGFPTVNLAIEPNKLVPGLGIYAGWARTSQGVHAAALSVGYRPTFEDTQLRVEAYLLDFDGDLYWQRLEVSFVERLRDEVKYDSPEELAAQIALDVEETRRILGAP